jgi:hypothetical protein
MPVPGTRISLSRVVQYPAVDVYEGKLIGFFGRITIAFFVVNEVPNGEGTL